MTGALYRVFGWLTVLAWIALPTELSSACLTGLALRGVSRLGLEKVSCQRLARVPRSEAGHTGEAREKLTAAALPPWSEVVPAWPE